METSICGTNQNLLDIPRLNLNDLDQDTNRVIMSPSRKKSTASSGQRSQKPGQCGNDDATPPAEALLEEESPRQEKQQTKCANLSWIPRLRVVMPHLALATVVIVYTLVGAAIFYAIERSDEEQEKMQIAADVQRLRDEYLERMWNRSQDQWISGEQFVEEGLMLLEDVMEETLKAFEEGLTDESIYNGIVEITWTYTAAVLFSATVITTVGYGNLVPRTFWSRVFCIAYALFGIPLTLITIADIGKFVGSMITWAYAKFIIFTDIMVNILQRVYTRLHPGRYKSKRSSLIISRKRSHRLSTISGDARRVSDSTEIGGMGKTVEDGVDEEKVSCGSIGTVEEGNEEEIEDEEDEEEDDEEEEDDIPVPPSFILLIVVGFTAFSSLLFTLWENWPYLDSFYYCLITITTVGFGDLVPSDDSYTPFVLLFIFFGLILATMCIDMVGTHYITKIHYMGRKLEDAKAALAFIGGKAVNLKTWAKELRKMQRQYGMTDEQMRQLMENPEEYVQMMEAARMGMLQARGLLRAYEPRDAEKMRYIDQNGGTLSHTPTSRSQALSTARSTVRTRTTLTNV